MNSADDTLAARMVNDHILVASAEMVVATPSALQAKLIRNSFANECSQHHSSDNCGGDVTLYWTAGRHRVCMDRLSFGSARLRPNMRLGEMIEAVTEAAEPHCL